MTDVSDSLGKWKPPDNWLRIKTVDVHAGGEPLRIVIDGYPELHGDTILARRRYAKEHFDHLRTALVWEPRGHADMYGCIITPPVTEQADFGILFLHNEGYSSMCGHGIIALTKVVLDTGIIIKEGSRPVLKIDSPAGRITAKADRKNGIVRNVSFRNVPSFVYLQDQTIDVPEIGSVRFDIAFGGAFYAFCYAEDLGVTLDGQNYNNLIDTGRKIKHAIMGSISIMHPFEEDLGFLYGTILVGKPVKKHHHCRHVCIFADGELDRSPTGTGVSARAAILWIRKELEVGQDITIESILGTTMNVRIVETREYGPFHAVIPEVMGSASITGQCQFYFDPKDPLSKGFILH